MLRFIARIWAKLAYVFKEEVKGAENELNARAGFQRFQTITAEADALDKRIVEVTEMEEKGFWLCENGHEEPISTAFAGIEIEVSRNCSTCKKPMKYTSRDTMTGQEKYESDKERDEAVKMAAAKRKDADDAQKAAQYFAKMAAQSREFADRLRSL